MAIPVTITHRGSVSGAGSPGAPTTALQNFMSTAVTATLGGSKGGRPAIVGATVGAPFVFPLEGITRVRFLAVKARGGGGHLRLTSALGTDQVVPLGSEALHLWSSLAAGDELTAVKFVGSADLEYILAGDVG
jgi:hypothetical protein